MFMTGGWTPFSKEEIEQTVATRGLLSIELELTDACNFNCIYCYHLATEPVQQEAPLSDSELRDVVTQAKALGARLVVLLGGEPLLHPNIGVFCEWLHGQDLCVDIFTNGSGLTTELAELFCRNDVRVVLKMNSADAACQNRLAARADAYDTIQAALANLRAAGYPAETARLGISNVIFRDNLDETESLWRWARREGIEPYFERLNPCGEADALAIPPAELERVFLRLAEIDRVEFGRNWLPRPPLVGHACLRHQFSCTVTTDGHVQPCVGVTCSLGSVRQAPLKQILRDSEMMEVLRHFRENIKGPCAQCELSDECYGCRGTAWQLTGDALASDPLCWRNAGKSIPKLPADAAPYVPQEPPMRMLTRLLRVGEKMVEAEAVIARDAVCLLPDGTMEPAFYAELAAQAFGAGISLRNWRRNGDKPVEGLLLGMSGFQVHGVARAGDVLTITVRTACEMDGFAVLDGCVLRGEEVLAEGSLKVCNQPIPKACDD